MEPACTYKYIHWLDNQEAKCEAVKELCTHKWEHLDYFSMHFCTFGEWPIFTSLTLVGLDAKGRAT